MTEQEFIERMSKVPGYLDGMKYAQPRFTAFLKDNGLYSAEELEKWHIHSHTIKRDDLLEYYIRFRKKENQEEEKRFLYLTLKYEDIDKLLISRIKIDEIERNGKLWATYSEVWI